MVIAKIGKGESTYKLSLIYFENILYKQKPINEINDIQNWKKVSTKTWKEIKTKSLEPIIRVRVCEKCSYVYEPILDRCPICEHQNEKKDRVIDHKPDGELIEYSMTPEQIEQMKRANMISDFYKLSFIAKKRGLPDSWIYQTIKSKHDPEIIRKYGHTIKMS
jgi:hypothetical protein